MGTYIDQGKVEFQHEDTSDFRVKALIMSQIACFNAEILHGMNEWIILRINLLLALLSQR